MNNQPIKKIKHGAVSLAVFENNFVRNGQNMKMQSASLTRNYKDKLGNWQKATSFGVNDIPKAILCLQKAYEFLTTAGEAGNASQ